MCYYRINSNCFLELNPLLYKKGCISEEVSAKFLNGFRLSLIFGIYSQSRRDLKSVHCVPLRIGQMVEACYTSHLDQNCPWLVSRSDTIIVVRTHFELVLQQN